MSKRYTDTDIWAKRYFHEAPLRIKLLWKFLYDNCDIAGVWDGNFKLASFQIGEEVTEKDFEKYPDVFQGRIERLDGGKWLLPTFIQFQYGTQLSPHSQPQYAVIRCLEKHRLLERFQGFIKGYDSLILPLPKSWSKAKDKDKDKGTDKEGKIKVGEYVYLTSEEAQKLIERLGSKQRARACVDILDNYLGEPGNENKYKSHYRAILRWVEPELIKREKKGAVHYKNNGSMGETSRYDSMIQCPKCTTRHNEKACPSCGALRPEAVKHG